MFGWLFPERTATTVRLSTETGELLEWNRTPWMSVMHSECVSVNATACYVLTEQDLPVALEMARDAIHRFKCMQPAALASQES